MGQGCVCSGGRWKACDSLPALPSLLSCSACKRHTAMCSVSMRACRPLGPSPTHHSTHFLPFLFPEVLSQKETEVREIRDGVWHTCLTGTQSPCLA